MKLLNRGSIGAIDIVYFAIVLIVGVGIYASIATNLMTNMGATTTPQYAAASNVTANVYSGFQTIASAPTIMAAVVILGIVGLLMMRR